ncbi:hypothetical protein ID852_14700, partial [Xenorhabdus sp. 42]|uniref:hypothetical protein n=1 Tax=Xenorhabdus szentirmaii TaxID=290112 RepID=UPI0019CA1FB4
VFASGTTASGTTGASNSGPCGGLFIAVAVSTGNLAYCFGRFAACLDSAGNAKHHERSPAGFFAVTGRVVAGGGH